MGEQGTTTAAGADEVAALVRAAAVGQVRPVYVFTGDGFETGAAARALIEALVPASDRAFNVETYDGRTTPLSVVLDSLRTVGFCRGVKVVWVRDSPLFLSGEKRADVTAALLAAWGEGRQRDAAEKLLTLVGMAGWSQEQFVATRWAALSAKARADIFGHEVEAEAIAQLDAVQAVCGARGLSVSAFRDDGSALVEYLRASAPVRAVLVLTVADFDARKRLFKQVREQGAVVDVRVPRERSGALSRGAVEALVEAVLQRFGKQATAEAHALILKQAGTETALLSAELEKLCLYAGDEPVITPAHVQAVFTDMAESWIFDFTGALASRQLAPAATLLHGLLARGEAPLRLLALIAREIRLLLAARECLDGALRGTWRRALPFNVFQAQVLPHLDAETRQVFGQAHPFVLYRRFQDASQCEARALRRALVELSAVDVRLKSSRCSPRLLLEAFVIDWCRTGATPPTRAGGARSAAR